MATVDVIIPTYKPGEKFLKLLGMLDLQTVRPEKVIILYTMHKNLSCDGLKDRINKFFRKRNSIKDHEVLKIEIVPVRKNEFDHALTREKGVRKSTAEYFLMMTDDAVPSDNRLIEKLVKRAKEGASAVFARQIAFPDAKKAEKLIRAYNYPANSYVRTRTDFEAYGIRTCFTSDSCMLYDRHVFDVLGGYGSEPSLFAEDARYAHKMLMKGYKLAYEGSVWVNHSHNYSYIEQLHRNFDIGANQKMYPEIYSRYSSEKEGVSMAKEIIMTLKDDGDYPALIDFVINCGIRYVGYLLGKNYKLLPKKVVMALTGNQNFFGKYFGDN